jgi:hypothetical protein
VKPAFSEITFGVDEPRKEVLGWLTIQGPIDLEAKEETDDVYVWVRITQLDGEKVVAEAIGAGEMDEDAIDDALQDSADQLKAIVNPLAGGPVGASTEVVEKIRDVTAMWKATIPISEGDFDKEGLVNIEAWALVRTKKPPRVFHVYWEENGFQLPSGAVTRPVAGGSRPPAA